MRKLVGKGGYVCGKKANQNPSKDRRSPWTLETVTSFKLGQLLNQNRSGMAMWLKARHFLIQNRSWKISAWSGAASMSPRAMLLRTSQLFMEVAIRGESLLTNQCQEPRRLAGSLPLSLCFKLWLLSPLTLFESTSLFFLKQIITNSILESNLQQSAFQKKHLPMFHHLKTTFGLSSWKDRRIKRLCLEKNKKKKFFSFLFSSFFFLRINSTKKRTRLFFFF